jgi:hypothetical protein
VRVRIYVDQSITIMYVYTHTYIHKLPTYTRICMYVFMHVCMHVCVCVVGMY